MDRRKELILSFAAALLIPLTLTMTAVSNVYNNILCFPFLFWAAGGFLTAFLGFFAGRRIKQSLENKLHAKRIMLVAIGAIVLSVSIFAVSILNMSSLAYMFIPAAELMWYRLGCKLGLGLDLLSNAVLGAIGLEAAFLFPMCQSFDESGTAANIFLAVFGAEIVICAVLINIRHLKKITLRGKSSAALSKNTVRFNMRISLLFAFTVLFFFLFAPFAGYWLWEGIKALIRFLLSITMKHENIDKQIVNELLNSEEIKHNEASPVWLIILLIIVIVTILFMIKPIKKALLELLKRLGERIDGIKSEDSQELAYTDFYETAEIEKKEKNNFKHAYKVFLKEKNPVNKYRFGYKAFMIGLDEAGEKVSPSDTTQIHLAKEENILGSDLAEKVIEQYESLRYDDRTISAGDCIQMDMLLKQLKQTKAIKNHASAEK